MEQRIIYIGLDVHKDTIGRWRLPRRASGELREHGKIANTPAALKTPWRSWRVMAGAFDFAKRPAPAATSFSAS